MSDIDLTYTLNIPNEQAIEYFKNKKIVPFDKLKSLGEAAHAKAFTVSNINHLGLLSDMKASLDEALRKGEPFEAWRDNLMQSAAKKGWVSRQDMINPESGEVLPPYRLRTIFKTNMSTAFHASRYHSQMETAIDFPYWEFVSVGDAVTRPSHLALSGIIKRYDDPFWQTYYPPIDWNCRCTVVSRSDYYVKKRGLTIDETPVQTDNDGNFVERQGIQVKANKSFSYNSARHGFRPNLDQYDKNLAIEFSKRDMQSPEFLMQYQRLQQEYLGERQRLGIEDGKKLGKNLIDELRNKNRHHINFTAGVITDDLPVPTKTVWLSDDTLLKQFNSRLGDSHVNPDYYAKLPEMLASPDYILDDEGKYVFLTQFGDNWSHTVLRVTKNNEVYLDSTHYLSDKRIQKLLDTLKVIKKP